MAWIKPSSLLSAPDARVTALDERGAVPQVELQIAGLVCGVCAGRVAASLRRLDGVASASCDLDSATARVQLSGPLDEAALRQAVRGAAIALPLRRAIQRAAGAVGL